MAKTVSEKMGVVEGARTFLQNAPDSAVAAMRLPGLKVGQSLRGTFDYIHLFATSQAEMDEAFPRLTRHLKPTGMLWVSWPKARQLDSDLTLAVVIRIGYSHGVVESKTLSIDATWSGIKFTHPKPGKKYHNKYGELPPSVQDV